MDQIRQTRWHQSRKTYLLLTQPEGYRKTNKVLNLFVHWCSQVFSFTLYDYELEIAWWLLASLFMGGFDVYVKMARQSGKTETLTLLVRFLIIFYELIFKRPLMAAFASPKGEQAKTDVDRIKKSLPALQASWQVEDREFNAKTVRAYRFERLFAEIFVFSLAPTTDNESKTLNLLIIEEAHKADDQKRSDQLDSMLSSTGGPTWAFGVGCPRTCDFYKGSKGDLPDSISLVIGVGRIFRDRRAMYRKTGDPSHLAYEKKIRSEIRKKGKANPEIRRNYFVEDTVEEGNFISRERLLSMARSGSAAISIDQLYLGGDWARRSDFTWFGVGNDQNDVLDWLKVPHDSYENQCQMIKDWLEADRIERKAKEDGTTEEITYRYVDRILAVRCDSTGGTGDAPNEMLRSKTALPMGDESFYQFTLQSKSDLYLNFETALFRDAGDPLRFSYPADHPLAAEFEEQMVALVREYKGDREYLSVHHPEEAGAKDDAPDCTALMVMAGASGSIGQILFG